MTPRGDGVDEAKHGILGEGVVDEKERFLDDEYPDDPPADAEDTLVVLKDGRARLGFESGVMTSSDWGESAAFLVLALLLDALWVLGVAYEAD